MTRTLKPWQALPKKQKDAILEMVEQKINEGVDREEAQLQKAWLQMACILVHKLGHDKDDCMMFLGGWKRLYHTIGKCKTNEERDAYLKTEMEKIFGEGGYPYEWVDSLEK